MLSVRADDEPRTFRHRAPALLPTGDPALLDADLGDLEALADLGAGGAGGVDEDGVEDLPARAEERVDALEFRETAGQNGRAGIEPDLAGCRGTRCDHLVEQAPAGESRDPWQLHLVRRERVAREARLVHHEHAEATAAKQHPGRRSPPPWRRRR